MLSATDWNDFFERHRGAALVLRGLDAEQAADGEQLLRLLVHDRRERAVFVERVAAYRVLEQRHGLGRPGVRLAAHAEQIFAADFERAAQHRGFAEGIAMPQCALCGDFIKPYALDEDALALAASDAIVLRMQPSQHGTEEPFTGNVLGFIGPVRQPET